MVSAAVYVPVARVLCDATIVQFEQLQLLKLLHLETVRTCVPCYCSIPVPYFNKPQGHCLCFNCPRPAALPRRSSSGIALGSPLRPLFCSFPLGALRFRLRHAAVL